MTSELHFREVIDMLAGAEGRELWVGVFRLGDAAPLAVLHGTAGALEMQSTAGGTAGITHLPIGPDMGHPSGTAGIHLDARDFMGADQGSLGLTVSLGSVELQIDGVA